ncbi:MAG: hypothetical protein EBR30_01220 [Cytophagia bacterium]|jgi:hypothetical protein|nr:hypothetical protein [Cytophagia bacterium]
MKNALTEKYKLVLEAEGAEGSEAEDLVAGIDVGLEYFKRIEEGRALSKRAIELMNNVYATLSELERYIADEEINKKLSSYVKYLSDKEEATGEFDSDEDEENFMYLIGFDENLGEYVRNARLNINPGD